MTSGRDAAAQDDGRPARGPGGKEARRRSNEAEAPRGVMTELREALDAVPADGASAGFRVKNSCIPVCAHNRAVRTLTVTKLQVSKHPKRTDLSPYLQGVTPKRA